jgi:hypothetical protein
VTILKSYQADLSSLGSRSLTILASGFFDSTANQDGRSFRLLGVLADGITFLLPEVPTTSVREDLNAPLPRSFELAQNYPNPFNPSTNIEFSLPQAQDVTLKIYNLLGREVETLVDQKLEAGSYSVQFDAGDKPSGVYFYRLEAGGNVTTKKMSLIK